MSRRAAYKEIDHCGDIGIEAWGATQSEVFEQATLGLLSLMSTVGEDIDREHPVERKLSASAVGPSDLLVDWLGEVILAAATHGEVYAGVRIDSCDDESVRGVVWGTPVKLAGESFRFDVKAATYHELLYECVDDQYHARVIFDL